MESALHLHTRMQSSHTKAPNKREQTPANHKIVLHLRTHMQSSYNMDSQNNVNKWSVYMHTCKASETQFHEHFQI